MWPWHTVYFSKFLISLVISYNLVRLFGVFKEFLKIQLLVIFNQRIGPTNQVPQLCWVQIAQTRYTKKGENEWILGRCEDMRMNAVLSPPFPSTKIYPESKKKWVEENISCPLEHLPDFTIENIEVQKDKEANLKLYS